MPQLNEKESGLVKFQAQEDINKKNREERRRKKELILAKITDILNEKNNKTREE
ncbi:hypothetical protein [Lentibacillus sediminis]|uniref:hypothetical protein n=1 Tax=Lentibacillus sediminis TaxID=1940529 RepID=UPI0013045EC3|nr:hypothetical protein [Lentibacillus sediminis]